MNIIFVAFCQAIEKLSAVGKFKHGRNSRRQCYKTAIPCLASGTSLLRQCWRQSNLEICDRLARLPHETLTQQYALTEDRITNYLSSTNVQLGATYSIGKASTKLFNDGVTAVARYINASPEEVVLGPSTTQLFRNLSVALFEYIQPGDEIIASKLDHEANIASWVQLAKDRNATLKWYEPKDKKNPQLEPEVLRGLLSDKTKLVAVTHTSNILGTINDIKAIAQEVHRIPGALLCVDAVAYAPHRGIDVKDLEVDFYSFSW